MEQKHSIIAKNSGVYEEGTMSVLDADVFEKTASRKFNANFKLLILKEADAWVESVKIAVLPHLYLKKICLYIFIISVTLCLLVKECSSKVTNITIVHNNQPEAVIIISVKATEQIRSAAYLLSSLIKKSTNAELKIINETDAVHYENSIRIWIGQSNYVKKQNIKIAELDEDGFFIAFPDQKNIVIVGPTDWGTEFGTYDFLERYLGIRWLLPGLYGDHVPFHHSIMIPIKEIRQEPTFFSRQFSSLNYSPAQNIWARRNRMHARVRFHHNLINLFPPELYTKTHPELFPIRNGIRYLPVNNKDHKWQPCFSTPISVDEAIKRIVNYFDLHPNETSYSLGINDGPRGIFCTCDRCRNKYAVKNNFLNFIDYSDTYYSWVNKVAEGVLKIHTDKWFGCLAYHEVAGPPLNFKLNPRIIPFMTYDRLKWADKEIESEGKHLTEQWQKKALILGWYDYLYGTPYMVPRIYFHKMADYYRYGRLHGVRAMFSEVYPNWGEGPKLYIALKLQWNVDSDVDKLLKEWYIAAVGSDAAPELEEYYNLWETFWTVRIHSSKWFLKDGGYLRYNDPGYLDIVMYEDIIKSRKLLESVVAKTKNQYQRFRANIILRAFEYYEASVIAYLGLVKNALLIGKDKHYYEDYEKKRLNLLNDFENDPILIHPIRFDNYDSLKFK